MNWYYLREDGFSGPHKEREMADLARVGVIAETSLVWSAGLNEWTRVTELGGLSGFLHQGEFHDGGDEMPESPPTIQIEKCAASGQLGDRNKMLEYGHQYVLPEFKDQFARGLYENVKDVARDQLELVADLSVFTCLKQTFQIIRKEWALFFGLILVFSVPVELLTTYFSFHVWDPEGFASIFIPLIVELTVGTLIASGLYAVAASHWQFKAQPVGNIFKTALGNWPRLIKVRLQVWVAGFVGSLLFIVPGVFLAFMLMFAEALVFSSERETGMNALTGSWNLVKNRFWKALLFALAYLGIVASPLFLLWFGYSLSPFEGWLYEAGLYLVQDILIGVGVIYFYCAMEHFDAQ